VEKKQSLVANNAQGSSNQYEKISVPDIINLKKMKHNTVSWLV